MSFVKLRRVWPIIMAMVLAFTLILLYKSLTVSKDFTPKQEKAFPAFTLADVRVPEQILSLADLKGQINIVHVWATWCGICVNEHTEWLKIQNKWSYPLIGIVYRDEVSKVKKLLQAKGDPYHYLLNDISGTLGISLGLLGTPETFVIDKQGQIRYHHYGPITLNKFENQFVPLLEKISQENA